jgi:hypothetical protein
VYWQSFFNIFPFSVDREDARIAQLISVLTYAFSQSIHGKILRTPYSVEMFIPDYLGTRNKPAGKSLEQQEQEMLDFKKRFNAAQGLKNAA